MDNKTKVIMENDDKRYRDWIAGEEGYIDGYVRGGDNRPYCAIVLGDRVVFAMCYEFKVIS